MAIEAKKDPERGEAQQEKRTPIPLGAKEGGQDSPRSMLLDRAKSGSEEKQRLYAVSELSSDAGALKEILRESMHRDSRNAAADILFSDDGAVVELLASDNKNASSAMLERLMREPARLMDVAKSCMNIDARSAALEKIKDHAQLVEIAKYSIYADSRAGALRRLEGSAVEEIAASSSYRDTRLSALEMIKSDGEALARVESASLYEDTRKDAHAMMPEFRKRS
jgi:hypothetical protein